MKTDFDRDSLADYFGGKQIALYTIAKMGGIELPTTQKKFSSPFRVDKNPSCHVWFAPSGESVFWDSGDKDFQKVDFIRLYGLIFGCDDRQAKNCLCRIARGESVDGEPIKIPQIAKESINPRPLATPPELNNGWTEDLWELYKLRNIPFKTLERLRDEGWLRFCRWYGDDYCWVLREASGGGSISIRRLDGKEFLTDGEPSGKSRTFKLSPESFNGVGFLSLKYGNYDRVAITEGTPDLLAAHAFIDQLPIKDRRGIMVCCVFGATQSIPEEFIPFFSGKRVRFFPHCDRAGFEFVEREASRISQVADSVGFFSFAGRDRYTSDGVTVQPVKDLNDLCFETPESWERNPRINPLEF